MERTWNFKNRLSQIESDGNLRRLPSLQHQGQSICLDGGPSMLNLSSNDYLGLMCDGELQESFWEQSSQNNRHLSASSSRLLTGNFDVYTRLESKLRELYGSECALVFGSGYHANVGIVPAITSSQSLILADKLVHASLIDGIRLSDAKAIRYRHNDYEQLERLLSESAHKHDVVVIITESIFSMDGDRADLERLVALRERFSNVLLYVDEAHAVGAIGERGLGCAESLGLTHKIDILVGTFGKALASTGAYAICNKQLGNWLTNRARTLIFTTALPPLNLEWTLHVLNHIEQMSAKREHLASISRAIARAVNPSAESSHIIPIIVGESLAALELAEQLRTEGYLIQAVRPPTVPQGSSRLRISLSAAITNEQTEQICNVLKRIKI